MFGILVAGLLLLGSISIHAGLRYYSQDLLGLLNLRHDLLLNPESAIDSHCQAKRQAPTTKATCSTTVATRKSADVCAEPLASFTPRRYYYLRHRCLMAIELSLLR
ncbi:MAG: hypothetical protein OYH77_07325 [Pseudomonadota bacterium]|nr:hypothetical protein [Pseudomonadota bacterium]